MQIPCHVAPDCSMDFDTFWYTSEHDTCADNLVHVTGIIDSHQSQVEINLASCFIPKFTPIQN